MRWKATCAYNGRHFVGWQSQPDGKSVQDVIEKSLQKIFQTKIRIHGSSRTDSGVHARDQVFHFDANWKHKPEQLEAALGTLLPETIQVHHLRRVPESFHARFSAKGKRYRYFIFQGRADPFAAPFCWSLPRDLSISKMNEGASCLTGLHDFTSFAAGSSREKENPVKHLHLLSVKKRGRRITITAEASGFMYKMVRSLVGALVNVGSGKLSPDQLPEILQGRKRTPLVETAPPHGLFLEKVYYRQPKHW